MAVPSIDIDEDNGATAHELQPINTRICVEFRPKIIAAAHLRYDPSLNLVQRHDLARLPLRKGAILVALAAGIGSRRQHKARKAGSHEYLHQHRRLHGIGRLNRQ